MSNRKPTLSELIALHKREEQRREREILERATKRVTEERSAKRQQWLAFYGFKATDELATPSPDIPDDYNATPEENDYE